MIGLEGKSLRSERLTYRLLTGRDKPALRALLAERAVTEPAGFLPAGSDAEFERFFDGLTGYRNGVAILLGETLIGYISVYPYDPEMPEYDGKKCVGTGFVIGRDYHNRGYATEMLKTITDYLKTRFDFCFADHFVDNGASKRVIEKCGYRYCDRYTMMFEELGREMTCLSYVR